MLDVQQRTLVAKGGVVHGGEVPDEVRPGPQRQGDHGVGEQARPADRGRQPDHAERRSPLGQDDVLEQVDRQQIVERDRVQRRHEDGEDQCEPGHAECGVAD